MQLKSSKEVSFLQTIEKISRFRMLDKALEHQKEGLMKITVQDSEMFKDLWSHMKIKDMTVKNRDHLECRMVSKI